MGCGQSKPAADPPYDSNAPKRRAVGEKPPVAGLGDRDRGSSAMMNSRNGSRSDTELYSDLASRSVQGYPTPQRLRAGSRMDGRPGSRPPSGRLREPEVLKPHSSRMREQDLGYVSARPGGGGYLVREPLAGGTAVLPLRGASLRTGDERDPRRPPSTRMRDDYVSPQYRSLGEALPAIPGSHDDYAEPHYVDIAPPPVVYDDEYYGPQLRTRSSVREADYYAPQAEYREHAEPAAVEYAEPYGHPDYLPPQHPMPGIPVGFSERRASTQSARSRSPDPYDRHYPPRSGDPYERRLSARGANGDVYPSEYVAPVALAREETRQSRLTDRDPYADYAISDYDAPYSGYELPRPPPSELRSSRYEYDYHGAERRPSLSSLRQPVVVDEMDWYRRAEGPRRRPSTNSLSRRDAELDESRSSGGRHNLYGRARFREDDEMSNLSFESSRSNRTPPLVKAIDRSRNDSPRNSPGATFDGFAANEVNRIMHLHQAEIYRLYGTALFSPSVTGSALFTESEVKQMLDDQLERHSSLIKASDPNIVPPSAESVIAKYRAAPRKRDSFDSLAAQREYATVSFGQDTTSAAAREGTTRTSQSRRDSYDPGRRLSNESTYTPAPSLPRKEISEAPSQVHLPPPPRRESDRSTAALSTDRDGGENLHGVQKVVVGAPVARSNQARDERLTVKQVNAMLVKQTAAIYDELGAVLYCPPLVGAGTFSPELAGKILADKRRMQTTFETKPLFSSLEVNSFLEQQVHLYIIFKHLHYLS